MVDDSLSQESIAQHRLLEAVQKEWDGVLKGLQLGFEVEMIGHQLRKVGDENGSYNQGDGDLAPILRLDGLIKVLLSFV